MKPDIDKVERKRIRMREWRKRNREKLNQYAAIYRETHKKNICLANLRYKLKHPERLKQLHAESYLRHREKSKARMSEYQKNNRPKANARLRAWRKANWSRFVATLAKREALKRNAYPKWANNLFIEEIYDLARLRSHCLGIQHHVDHIVPLQSDIVCGLQCEQNLRVIPASTNTSKGNRHWPEMP